MPWLIWTGRPVQWWRRRAMFATILAIESGRFNSVLCWYVAVGKIAA
jgi:hypothetical protein